MTELEEKHEWFHEPNEKHPEIPDITIPRDIYPVSMNNLRVFLCYDGSEVDFKDRYRERRLVKFICPIERIMVCGSQNNVDLYPRDILLLLTRLRMYTAEELGFQCIRIRNNEYSDEKNYPPGYYLTRIKSLFFHKCRIESTFLDFCTKSCQTSGTKYNLKLIYFVECAITALNLKVICKNLKTNYILLYIKWGNKDRTHIENFSEEPMTLKSSIKLEMEQMRTEIDDYLKRNQQGYEKCKWAVLLMLLAHRYRKGNVFNTLPVDVLRIIAKMVWASVGTQIWCYSISLDFLEDDLAEFL